MKLLSRLATTLTRPSGCCPGNLSADGWDAERNCRSFVELWVAGAGVSTHRHYLRSAEAGGSCYRPRRTSGRLKLRMREWCPSWLWWPPSGGRWAKRVWHWRCWPAAPGWTLDLGRGKKYIVSHRSLFRFLLPSALSGGSWQERAAVLVGLRAVCFC